jgi:hypothetical protein
VKITIYLFFCLGFFCLVVFLPKDSTLVAKHSLIISTIALSVVVFFRRALLCALNGGVFKVFLTVTSIYIISMLCLVGYLLAFNAMLGKQEVICIKGEIIHKFKDESKFGNVNYYFHYIDRFSGTQEVMRVTIKEYANYDIGSEVEKSWRSGPLGYVYQTVLGEGPGNVRYTGCESGQLSRTSKLNAE